MTQTPRWTRRKVLTAGATLAAGGAALEWMSLRGSFDNRRQPQVAFRDAFTMRLLELDELQAGGVLHIGQSTHLIALGGVRVLTDPWFNDPAFGSLVHNRPLPCTPETLGSLDVIAITHDHPDHADRRALDRLDKSALMIVGVKDLVADMRRLGFAQVEYLPTWKELAIGPLRVTATPALHDVPEAGFVMSVGDTSIYFAGDTATHPGLPEMAERWRLTLAMLPIDGTRLKWEPRLVMDPSDAAAATALLRPRQVMSSHADAVQSDLLARHLLTETVAQPHALFRRLVGERVPEVQCTTPSPGDLLPLLSTV